MLESFVQELLRVSDRFQLGGAVRALSGRVWTGDASGDCDTAAGVDAHACSRGGLGGRDGVRGGQLPCHPGRLRAGGLWGCRCLVAADVNTPHRGVCLVLAPHVCVDADPALDRSQGVLLLTCHATACRGTLGTR